MEKQPWLVGGGGGRSGGETTGQTYPVVRLLGEGGWFGGVRGAQRKNNQGWFPEGF